MYLKISTMKFKVAMVNYIVIHWNANHYGHENDRRCHDADRVEEDNVTEIMLLCSPIMFHVFIAVFLLILLLSVQLYQSSSVGLKVI